MSFFIRKNFSYPPKVFLSETLYFELPKNFVISFKGALASLLVDTTKISHSYLLLLNSNLWKPSESTQNYLQAPKTIHNHP